MIVKAQLTYETEKAIRKACDSVTMRNNATLLLELWDRGLITDEIFARKMLSETGIFINPFKKET